MHKRTLALLDYLKESGHAITSAQAYHIDYIVMQALQDGKLEGYNAAASNAAGAWERGYNAAKAREVRR